jgi:hypothetical protein
VSDSPAHCLIGLAVLRYGFNAGSTLGLGGNLANVAGKVVVNTTLAGAMGGIVSTFVGKMIFGIYDISMGLNGVLAGLVSITANCQAVAPWHAIMIGSIGAVLLIGGHFLLKRLRIDDPCDAAVVHGICGTWGLWAAGIFCTDANVQYAGYPNTNTACASGEQFGVQVVGSLIIFVWTIGMSAIMFLSIKYTLGMRIAADAEDMGLDASEHGAGAPLSEEELKPTGAGELQQMPQVCCVPRISVGHPLLIILRSIDAILTDCLLLVRYPQAAAQMSAAAGYPPMYPLPATAPLPMHPLQPGVPMAQGNYGSA